MFNVKFTGFKTIDQAREFINWYEGQGEQDSAIWFEENLEGVSSIQIDTTIPYLVEDNTLVAKVEINT